MTHVSRPSGRDGRTTGQTFPQREPVTAGTVWGRPPGWWGERVGSAGEGPGFLARQATSQGAEARSAVVEIARRKGVIGLIMAQHQMNDGLHFKRTSSFDDTLKVIYRHIDRIHKIVTELKISAGCHFQPSRTPRAPSPSGVSCSRVVLALPDMNA